MSGHGDVVGTLSHGDIASVPIFVRFVSKGLSCAAIKHLFLHSVEWPPLPVTVTDSFLPFVTGHTLDTGCHTPANNGGYLPPPADSCQPARGGQLWPMASVWWGALRPA